LRWFGRRPIILLKLGLIDYSILAAIRIAIVAITAQLGALRELIVNALQYRSKIPTAVQKVSYLYCFYLLRSAISCTMFSL
jgi:hypothetical protein